MSVSTGCLLPTYLGMYCATNIAVLLTHSIRVMLPFGCTSSVAHRGRGFRPQGRSWFSSATRPSVLCRKNYS